MIPIYPVNEEAAKNVENYLTINFANMTTHYPNQDAMQEEMINLASFAKNLEAEAQAIDDAIKAMEDRRDTLKSRSDNLKKYIKHSLDIHQITEIKTCPYFAIKIKKNPAKVDIEPGAIIPDEYLRTKTIQEIDKAKISDELKNGVILDFAKLVQSTRLEIR